MSTEVKGRSGSGFDAGRDARKLLKELALAHRRVLRDGGISRAEAASFRTEIQRLVADIRAQCTTQDRVYARWRQDHFFNGSYEYLHESFAVSNSSRAKVAESSFHVLAAEVADEAQWRNALGRTRRTLGRTCRPMLETPPPFIDSRQPLTLVASRLEDLSSVRRKNSHVRRWARRQLPIALSLYLAMQGHHTNPPCRPFEFAQAVAVAHAARRRRRR